MAIQSRRAQNLSTSRSFIFRSLSSLVTLAGRSPSRLQGSPTVIDQKLTNLTILTMWCMPVVLKKAEWNMLVQLIRSDQLTEL